MDILNQKMKLRPTQELQIKLVVFKIILEQ